MYKRLSSNIVFSHPRITLVHDQIELPGGEQADYLWVDGWLGAVTVIPRDTSGNLLVETEYSYLPNEAIYQFPGGGIHSGELPEAAANRELTEELDLYAGRLIPIGSYLLDHRRTHAVMHVFIGEELTHQTSPSKDIYEVSIGATWMSEDEINAFIAGGKIVNASMLACWTLYNASKYGQK
jgi:ADP-ribose pyrophosphatase